MNILICLRSHNINRPKFDQLKPLLSVLIPKVDNYTTAVEKTPQERDLEGNLETETADDETDSPNNGADTAVDTENTQNKAHSEEIIPQVDNYTTAVEKTPQERYFDNMGADTADATNTLSKEDTQRIMSQAAQTIMKTANTPPKRTVIRYTRLSMLRLMEQTPPQMPKKPQKTTVARR